MGLPPNTQERAYQLARNGEVRDLQHLRQRLRREGYEPDKIPESAFVGLQPMIDRGLGTQPPPHPNISICQRLFGSKFGRPGKDRSDTSLPLRARGFGPFFLALKVLLGRRRRERSVHRERRRTDSIRF